MYNHLERKATNQNTKNPKYFWQPKRDQNPVPQNEKELKEKKKYNKRLTTLIPETQKTLVANSTRKDLMIDQTPKTLIVEQKLDIVDTIRGDGWIIIKKQSPFLIVTRS